MESSAKERPNPKGNGAQPPSQTRLLARREPSETIQAMRSAAVNSAEGLLLAANMLKAQPRKEMASIQPVFSQKRSGGVFPQYSVNVYALE